MFRVAESVGRRQRPLPGIHGLQGTRDHQFGLRVVDRPAGQRSLARRGHRSPARDGPFAGLSVEDSTGDAKSPLLPVNVAVERLAAARRAIDETGGDTLLVGRAENFVAGVPDLEDAITRLRAYAQAGADCLYAPGIQTREQIEAVVAAVRPKPVNLLIGGPSAFTLDELAKLGVRRVSVGGALARAAWGGLVASVQSLAEGRFDSLSKEPSGGWLNSVFKDPA
jgi:2-methylisocitrate lyase-like PEP mutase family enzyme